MKTQCRCIPCSKSCKSSASLLVELACDAGKSRVGHELYLRIPRALSRHAEENEYGFYGEPLSFTLSLSHFFFLLSLSFSAIKRTGWRESNKILSLEMKRQRRKARKMFYSSRTYCLRGAFSQEAFERSLSYLLPHERKSYLPQSLALWEDIVGLHRYIKL